MGSDVFRFKQFQLAQDHSAMKVGTDGVLLGAWCKIATAEKILDIGSGSGVIALMAAQRNPKALITAIEIESNAAYQSRINFSNSPWADRLSILHTGLIEFAQNSNEQFDVIICNPPYYPVTHFTSAAGDDRKAARNDIHLTFTDLLESAKTLLTQTGSLNLIFPVYELSNMDRIAEQFDLQSIRRTMVYPNKLKPCHRVLAEYSLSPCSNTELQVNHLIIQQSGVRNDFTEDYILLTKDFYINL